MKFQKAQTAKELATLLGAELVGNADLMVTGLNELNVVQEGDIAFVDHPKYYTKTIESLASAILINKQVDCPEGKTLLISKDPFRDFNKLIAHFSESENSVVSTEMISATSEIGKGTVVMPGAFIGDYVSIGDNCIIHPNVSIYHNCVIGNNVILHSGVVIGCDAFYYKKRPAGYERLISCGRVVLEDNVEIGALSSIDRGVTDETRIGEGTKIDNHVQVGHDTKVGRNCLFASQVGVSGACIIEDDVVLWGQVGVPSKIRIGKGAVLLGQSAPAKDVEGGKTYIGSPADESMKKFRELAMIRKLPEIFMNLNK